MGEHILTGSLIKVKEDKRTVVYNIEVQPGIKGVTGNVYLDRSFLPIFDKLLLTKAITDEHTKPY